MHKFQKRFGETRSNLVDFFGKQPSFKIITIVFFSLVIVGVGNYFVYPDFRLVLSSFTADISSSLELSPLLFFQVTGTIALQGIIVSYLLYRVTKYIDAIDTTPNS